MKLYLLSDNIDTQWGMRLAGVDGMVVHEREETAAALKEVFADKTIGVLLVTEKLAHDFPDLFAGAKLESKIPLIVEIPDRHGKRQGNSISEYVKEAVGINL